MGNEIDDITYKKLVLIKQLYQNAVVLATSEYSTINRILAVIDFDLSIETAIRAMVSWIDTSKTPAKNFHGLIQQADALLEKQDLDALPDKANIRHVHSIRNDAQHKAKYPNEFDVSDCRTYARDFLIATFDDIWKLDFETISMSAIVQDEMVRKYLLDSQTAFAEEDYQLCARLAAAALAKSLNRVKGGIVRHLFPFVDEFVLSDTGSSSGGREVYRAFEQIQETLLYLVMGIDYFDYMKLGQIVGNVKISLDGNPRFRGIKTDVDRNDAEFVLSYCIESVIKIEERVSDIEAPFGSGH